MEKKDNKSKKRKAAGAGGSVTAGAKSARTEDNAPQWSDPRCAKGCKTVKRHRGELVCDECKQPLPTLADLHLWMRDHWRADFDFEAATTGIVLALHLMDGVPHVWSVVCAMATHPYEAYTRQPVMPALKPLAEALVGVLQQACPDGLVTLAEFNALLRALGETTKRLPAPGLPYILIAHLLFHSNLLVIPVSANPDSFRFRDLNPATGKERTLAVHDPTDGCAMYAACSTYVQQRWASKALQVRRSDGQSGPALDPSLETPALLQHVRARRSCAYGVLLELQLPAPLAHLVAAFF